MSEINKTTAAEPVVNDVNLQDDVQAIMEKYDRESVTRHLTGPAKWLVFILSLLFAGVQLYSAFTGRIAATQLRPLHLGFVMMLVFLIYPISKKARRDTLPIYDILLSALAMGVCLYIALQHVELANRINKNTQLDLWVGGLLIVLLFECCRRVVGLPIMVVAGVFILYAYFGKYMPGGLQHRGFKVKRIITQLVYTTEGIMGTPLGASATFIYLFVLFGAFWSAPRWAISSSTLPTPSPVTSAAALPRWLFWPARWKALFPAAPLPTPLVLAPSPSP